MSADQLATIIRKFEAMRNGWGPTTSLDSMRADLDGMLGSLPPHPGADIDHVTVGGVPGRLVSSPKADPARIILHLHGGGFAMGSSQSHLPFATHLSAEVGARVLLLDYRLAPEHRFPAPLEDALAAYRGLIGQGLAPSRIAVSGDSAGGGLAVALLLAVRDEGLKTPACAAILSPWADMTCAGESYQSRAAMDPIGTYDVSLGMAQTYLKAGDDPRDPRASPVFGDFRGVPPLLIQAGEREVFFDDARALATKAERAGVQVRFEEWPGMIHQWQLYAGLLDEASRAIQAIGEFVRGSMD